VRLRLISAPTSPNSFGGQINDSSNGDLPGELSPAVRALTNPALRGAAFRVTTLRQVADAARLAIGELIGKLRCAAGLEAADPGGDRPSWASTSAVARTIDARAIIQSGGHPLAQVMGDLAALEPGQVYELVTPFVPAPLIDIANGKGFEAFSRREASDLVRTWSLVNSTATECTPSVRSTLSATEKSATMSEAISTSPATRPSTRNRAMP
jgi:uncharacterized protein (DUF2249 family)